LHIFRGGSLSTGPNITVPFKGQPATHHFIKLEPIYLASNSSSFNLKLRI
jgi:hypothetical protein